MPASSSTARAPPRHGRRRGLGQKHRRHYPHRHADYHGARGAVNAGEDQRQYAEGGPVVVLVGSHTLPERNFPRPISRMAGSPETTRYTLMPSTKATLTRAAQQEQRAHAAFSGAEAPPFRFSAAPFCRPSRPEAAWAVFS
jgi:hypothetical protein